MADTFRRNTLKGRKVRRVLGVRSVREAVGPIEPGCDVFGLTSGGWSLIDLVEYALEVTGPADVVVSTWTASGADLSRVESLLQNGRIRSLRFVVDPSFAKRQPALLRDVRRRFGVDAVCLVPNHAKFVTIRNDRWNLAIRTSMNLNENRRLENFELSDCAAMAEFLEAAVDRLFAADRAGRLF